MEAQQKLYSQKAISIATYFGGPAAAGYLVKKNYAALQQAERGQMAFVIGILFTLLLLAALFSVPEHIIDKVPNAVIPAIYTLIIYWIVEKTQGQALEAHKAAGGAFYSAWRATGIGALFAVVLVVLVVSVALVADYRAQPAFNKTDYEQQMERFYANETKALAVFKDFERLESRVLLRSLSQGIVLWEENIAILNRLNAIEALAPERLELQNKLLTYCELRIQHNELIIKALDEDSGAYDAEISRIGREINELLEELQ